MKKTVISKGLALLLALAVCCIPMTALGEGAVNSGSWQDKITAQLQEHMQTAAPEQKLPVYIWYTDIDYTQVYNQVRQNTGLTLESIDTDLAMPSGELLTAVATLSVNDANAAQVQDAFQLYIQQTSQQREQERQLAASYIQSERAVSRELYTEKATIMRQRLETAAEDILFQSQYAPTMLLYMTVSEIQQAARNVLVEEIGYYEEPEEALCTVESMKNSANLNRLYSELSALDGTGVKVGIIESGVPDAAQYDFINVGNIATHDHANNTMAALLAVAPEISVYATHGIRKDCIESMISAGVSIINASWGYYENGTYGWDDQWFDHLAAQHGVTVVASAGNNAQDAENNYIRCPAQAYNSIAVGAFDDKETASVADDALYGYSSYNNGPNCSKPDVVAPASLLGGGTSTSAPIVTGIVALMTQLKPSLAAMPQAIKAILQAACHRKAISTPTETMTAGLTDKQGAGVVDAYTAICIIGRNQYVTGTFTQSFEMRLYIPLYGAQNINVCAAWVRENYFKTGTTHSDTVNDPNLQVGNNQNVDLYVYDGTTLVKSSTNGNSSAEMAYFNAQNRTGQYRIQLNNTTSVSESVRYTVAWSTDNMTYRQEAETEGIYYLRSKSSNKYLGVSGNNIVQNAYTGTNEQRWMLTKVSDNTYKLTTGDTTQRGALALGTASGSSYNTALQSTGNLEIRLTQNTDGSYRIQHQNAAGTQWYSLDLPNSSQADGISPLWWASSHTADNQKWYLERAYYRHGDVNMDGYINNKDASSLQNCLADPDSYTACQLYLADTNLDGYVNNKDLAYLRSHLADSELYPL